MRTLRLWRVAVISCVLILSTVGGGPATAGEVRVENGAPPVGTVVAVGVSDGLSCTFEAVDRVVLHAPGDSAWQWLWITIDGECQAVVRSSWKGDVHGGDLPDPLADAVESELEDREGANELDSAVTSSEACKTSEQVVYMYGFGGTADRLTSQSGRIYFCWNLNYSSPSVRISSSSRICRGSTQLSWKWVVDGCATTSYRGGPDPNSVWSTVRGNYHCDPDNVDPCKWSTPSGYYHRLFNRQIGYSSGSSKCEYWYDGTIVWGVSREIVVGCR